MLPARFEFHRPDTLDQALALLARYGDEATPYAGGTELLIAMKARVLHYPHVVDIKRIADLHGVRRGTDGTLVIGSLSTHHQLAHDPVVLEHLPAYAELSQNIANIRVRVAGTLGGNLCFAEPHADPPALLCALGARVVLAGAGGRRSVPVEDFITGEFSTVREDGELMVAVEIPPVPDGARAAYRAFGHLERPAAGVAAMLLRGGAAGAGGQAGLNGIAWRFWVGSVCGRPTRMPALEAAAAGLDGDEALAAIERAAPAIAGQLEAHDNLHGSAEYKRHLVAVLAHRAAKACLS